MELIYSPLFPEIAPLTGEDFSARILRDLLRAQVVVCGEDFRFGTYTGIVPADAACRIWRGQKK